MPTSLQEKTSEAEFLKKKARDLIDESVDSSPDRMSEICVELTSIKAYFSEKLDNILVLKGARLEDLRTELGTVASAKSKWNATDEGRNEILIRGIILRIKDQISVLKQRLRVKELESYGQY